MQPIIKMYTTATCASCQMVKKWLKIKGLEYTEVRVDVDPALQQEAISLSGQTQVPVTVFEQGGQVKSVIVGFKPAQLSEAIA